ncbi:MAG: hypothetical protein KDH15_15035 [Rhodocyclaceae bacterium]|nr:hypothetical protein [Rhodocyclaceae bacterium]
MPIDLILPASMSLAILAWSLVLVWYVHPHLRPLPVEQALRPLLLLHSFRYVGLMFLIPGVTSEALDLRFAAPAAYGDLVAALLALAAIVAFRLGRLPGLAMAWLFSLWGFADLVNAVARGIRFTPDGALGATFWIPALIVPLLLVSHVYIFQRLVAEHRLQSARVSGQGV